MPDRNKFPCKQHVFPLNDWAEHNTESSDCWCDPKVDDFVVIHNSADGREDHEQGKKLK